MVLILKIINIDYNTTKITNENWHLNSKGSFSISESKSAIAKGQENDGSRNYQLNLTLKNG